MKISGLQKLTLLDYPGKIACTVFLHGCNFRCPFCHNASLVIKGSEDSISEEEFFSFLKKRQGILEGVCITGGEPTINSNLEQFIEKIKALGYCVKLDTNGYNPQALENILTKNIVDYVAMDIKNCEEKYSLTVDKEGFDIKKIRRSIELIKNSGIDFEFRTTVVKQFHTEEDLMKCAENVGKDSRYFLQQFKDSGELIYSSLGGYCDSELKDMCQRIKEQGYNVQVRGI